MSNDFQSIEPGQIVSKTKDAVWVMVVEDQETIRELCRQVIQFLGYRPLVAESGPRALEIMERQLVDIVIADIKTPGMGDGEMLREMKNRNPRVEIAIMTSYESVPEALKAIQRGASEYIIKPFSTEQIRVVIERLAQTLDLKDENRFLRERLESRNCFGQMIGQSPQMQSVFKMIQKLSSSRSSVLIMGESGTGKELAAQSIHEIGPWREKPFIAIDCASLAPSLIESELFGYVRGAFTGAAHNKEGLLETAKAGTIFFDEIGEIPLDLQGRLLRTIQEKEFRPVGSTRQIAFQSRIIAATNRDLKSEVQHGAFRKDLFYRLNVVSLTMPPLRERKMDIPLLVQELLKKLSAAQTGRRTKTPWSISSEALDHLLTYSWPGNVRELENCLERALALSSGPLINVTDLPSTLQSHSPAWASGLSDSVIPLEEMERQAIERALSNTGGDKLLAARLLGIGKTTLYRKLTKYQKETG